MSEVSATPPASLGRGSDSESGDEADKALAALGYAPVSSNALSRHALAVF